MNFDIDTKTLHSLGCDIMNLATEFNEEVETLFSKLNSITRVEGEWSGLSANSYVARAKIEKGDFVKFKNSLYKYGKTLCDIADEYDSAITKAGV